MAQWLISHVKTLDKLKRLARILVYLVIENPRTLPSHSVLPSFAGSKQTFMEEKEQTEPGEGWLTAVGRF